MEDNKDNQAPTDANNAEPAALPKEVTDNVAIGSTESSDQTDSVEPTEAVETTATPAPEPDVVTAAPSETDSVQEAPKIEDIKLDDKSTEPSTDTPEQATETSGPEQTPSTTDKDTLLASVATEKPKSGKKHVMVVVVAVLVMLSLIGAAVYAYLQASTQPIDETKDSSSQVQPQEEVNDPTSIDDVDAEIDKSIEALDSSSDLDDSDLSDESLGL